MQRNIKKVKMDTSRYHTNLGDLFVRREAGMLDYIQVPPQKVKSIPDCFLQLYTKSK